MKNKNIIVEHQKDFFREFHILTKDLRIDSTLINQNDLHPFSKFLAAESVQLPLYKAKNLENSVQHFLEDVLKDKIHDYHIKMRSSKAKRGSKSDTVFYITHKNKSLSYILKAFCKPREPSSLFLPEIVALDFIKQQNLPNIIPVESLALALSQSENIEWGLLLQTAAKGQRLDTFIRNIHEKKQSPTTRELYLKKAATAFNRMGSSLAQLHSNRSTTLKPFPQVNIDRFIKKWEEVQCTDTLMTKLQSHLDLNQFSAYVQSQINVVREVFIYCSYNHGDAHLNNMFYDELNDHFYFIDVSKMYKSIGHHEPLLDGTLDLLRAEENFQRKAIGHLTEEEMSLLTSHIYEGYNNVSKHELDERLINFYRTRIKLGRLLSYFEYEKQKDPMKQLQEKLIFESALEYFQKALLNK